MGRLALGLFGIAPGETSFDKRGFRCDEPEIRSWLEQVGLNFVLGYRAGLQEDRAEPLAARLEAEIEPAYQGFAFEGAGMALAILDAVTPWKRDRFRRFVLGPGSHHNYIVYVGLGFALARLPLSVDRALARLDPVLGWLALDGYGFHEGFFHWPRAVDRQEVPRRLTGYARRAFDQGVGRSLWFVEGASVERLARTIGAFAKDRRGDLWSGVGLACTYAGGRDRESLLELLEATGPCRPSFLQGAAFAAECRARAGNPTPHTELACRVFCGLSLEELAGIAATAGEGLPSGGAVPAYEIWRQRVQERLGGTAAYESGASSAPRYTLEMREHIATA